MLILEREQFELCKAGFPISVSALKNELDATGPTTPLAAHPVAVIQDKVPDIPIHYV